MATDRHEILRVDDLCHELGASRSTVCRWLRQGIIPGSRVHGRWYVLRSELVEALRPTYVACADCAHRVPVDATTCGGVGLRVCSACSERLVAAGGVA